VEVEKEVLIMEVAEVQAEEQQTLVLVAEELVEVMEDNLVLAEDQELS
jgi:hypothetical protein